ncbi:unnamed protein product [Litomosoides sigmodontis]|uniref:Uncharacterized protein n=1 Tax=Litomosoides sigmodontis TaxID=42156 RepID=A0A3P6T9T6_LITSI|nr:unnamed protein product [Litomosoides sigmodontis]
MSASFHSERRNEAAHPGHIPHNLTLLRTFGSCSESLSLIWSIIVVVFFCFIVTECEFEVLWCRCVGVVQIAWVDEHLSLEIE